MKAFPVPYVTHREKYLLYLYTCLQRLRPLQMSRGFEKVGHGGDCSFALKAGIDILLPNIFNLNKC